jgi:hypothetical protein
MELTGLIYLDFLKDFDKETNIEKLRYEKMDKVDIPCGSEFATCIDPSSKCNSEAFVYGKEHHLSPPVISCRSLTKSYLHNQLATLMANNL